MKRHIKKQNRVASTLLGLALAGVPGLCLAVTPITNSFDTDISGWVINYSTPNGGASATWNPTAGMGGGGCMQITLTNGGSKVGPLWQTMPASYSTADYWKYEFDMMIDPASGVDGNGGYGNLQTVMRDASWSWDSHWFGAIDSSYTSWKHISVTIPPLPVKTETMLGFEVGAASGTYNGDVIIYVDNVVISPMQNPWIVHAFTNDAEISADAGFSATAGGTPSPQITYSIDPTKDAGGGFTPTGSLKLTVAYDPTSSNWQEGRFQYNVPYDPARYSSFEFDVYIEAVSASGSINIFILAGDWSWNNVGTVNVNTNYIGKWTHCSIGLGAFTKTGGQGFVVQCGGGSLQPMTYYFDNIKFVKSYTAPSILKFDNGTPRGVQIVMDNDSAQWQREGISTPSEGDGGVFWYWDLYAGGSPVTYSFTLNDFPDAKVHRGFQAHLFFVNSDTDPSGTGDATNGSCDWNAADLIDLNLTANANGGYDYSLNWKTNKPAANTDHHVTSVHSDTAIGTWSLTFTDPTNCTLTGPGGISTNVTLPEDAVMNNFKPSQGFLHFGMFKNDGANDGHNNGTSGTFARVQKVGGSYTFDDSFNGTNLTANYTWRVSRASAVHWVPDGVGKWLTWSLPADGFHTQVAPAVTGEWKDVTNLVEFSTSTKKIGAIPAADIPAGNSAFFRLKSP